MKDQAGVWDAYIAGPVGESLLVPVNSYGRLLRVQLAGQDFLQLAEVQIYGMPGTPDQWPKAAPGGTAGAGETFSLAWRDGGPSTVNGRLYYTWPATTLMSTSAGSSAHPFNLGISSSAGNVTESGQTEKTDGGLHDQGQEA